MAVLALKEIGVLSFERQTWGFESLCLSFFPLKLILKPGFLTYGVMAPTYWDKHSILVLQELPKGQQLFPALGFEVKRIWQMVHVPGGWEGNKSVLARDGDDEKQGDTDWHLVFQNLFFDIGENFLKNCSNCKSCCLWCEASCHWIGSWITLWAGDDLQTSSSFPTLQSWHHFSRDLFCIFNIDIEWEKMPALWAAATQLGNWFLNALLL
jgi:hypothetical protein